MVVIGAFSQKHLLGSAILNSDIGTISDKSGHTHNLLNYCNFYV